MAEETAAANSATHAAEPRCEESRTIQTPSWSGERIFVCKNPRIEILERMVRTIGTLTSPRAIAEAAARGMREAYGPRVIVMLSVAGFAHRRFRLTRVLTLQGEDRVPFDNPWGSARDQIHQSGIVADLIASPEPKVIHHLQVESDPVLRDALSNCGSLVAVPLYEEGTIQGWVLFAAADPVEFNLVDVENAMLRSNMLGMAVRSAVLAEQAQTANRHLRREVEKIAAIQRALLPQEFPEIPGLSVSASYQTYDQAGGDYYDLIALPSRPEKPLWAMLVADASGHGPAAAVLVAMLHAALRVLPFSSESPAEILEYPNQRLFNNTTDGSFVTAFLGISSPQKENLTYAVAGHPPALLRSPGYFGHVQRLDRVGGLPLGIANEIDSGEASVVWNQGQTLLLYTDGITEATAPDGRMFGIRGIERAMAECNGEPSCVVEVVNAVPKQFEAGGRPGDDQTILALQRL